ncbi:sulfotransferase [Colwellia sp. BRX10-3]|uniref:sulfotransferase n=1 Tax=Colwellia sp. BRX10-3 TaxID=2759844 RepID=UPI0015F52437|nr:sulfotransferase [Colwellia sp. BRX10-3]MBA6391081.1 sulfotransferase [Colwellia sp. BRX10-3]
MNQFFIVGAQRSSTTWLYQMLQQHPQITMAQPIKPEPKYFLTQTFDSKKEHYEQKYFGNINSNISACGEKSTTYIESELAAQRIVAMYPNAKIIMLLRNPAERAISNYHFSVNNGLECRTMKEAILNTLPAPKLDIELSTDPFNYLGRGLYDNYIKLYQQYFSNDNILILCKELITTDLNQLQMTYEFLDVDKCFVPESFEKLENASTQKIEIPSVVSEYLNDYYFKTVNTVGNYCDVSCWSD